jgi:hypothetical protein
LSSRINTFWIIFLTHKCALVSIIVYRWNVWVTWGIVVGRRSGWSVEKSEGSDDDLHDIVW